MGHFRELIHDHENEMISSIVTQLENKILAKVMPKEFEERGYASQCFDVIPCLIDMYDIEEQCSSVSLEEDNNIVP